jgi:hypothetical protein
MGSPSPARTRRLLRVLALTVLVIGVVVKLATAAGPGGWDHLGDRARRDPTRWTSSPPRWR